MKSLLCFKQNFFLKITVNDTYNISLQTISESDPDSHTLNRNEQWLGFIQDSRPYKIISRSQSHAQKLHSFNHVSGNQRPSSSVAGILLRILAGAAFAGIQTMQCRLPVPLKPIVSRMHAEVPRYYKYIKYIYCRHLFSCFIPNCISIGFDNYTLRSEVKVFFWTKHCPWPDLICPFLIMWTNKKITSQFQTVVNVSNYFDLYYIIALFLAI